MPRIVAAGSVGAFLLILCGCASEGPLRAPSLKLPGSVRAVSAARSGNSVDLRWTNPSKTTDGVSLAVKHGAGPLSAEICRGEVVPAANCSALARVPVISGESATFHDTLPLPLTDGPARALHYRIRIANAAGRTAVSATVQTLAGAPPAPIANLSAAPVAGGIAVRWTRENAPTGRPMLRVLRGDGMPGKNSNSGGTLLSVGNTATTGDTGGVLDAGGHAGQAQRYTAYRMRTVRIGAEDLTMTSDAATVTVQATAKAPPPAPPAGLAAIANTLATPSIDLVWQPSTDPSATAYEVFRAEGDGQPAPLTRDPVRGFTFTDTAVRPGVTYRYTVRSVASDGRAGAPSLPISASLPVN